MEIASPQKLEIWPIQKLVPYDRNPRTHSEEQIGEIAASMIEFGFTQPILVASDAGILAGHGRLMAARQLKLARVPVLVLDHLTDAQRRAYIIADNRLAEKSGWDDQLLKLELQQLKEEGFDLAFTGFDQDEVEEMLESLDDPDEGETDADDAPEAETDTVSQRGDLWILGEHRLLVGDATDSDDIALLMGDHKADLIVTDPPYNVDYEGYTEKALKMGSDKMSVEEYSEFLAACFGNYSASIKQSGSFYVFHASSMQRVVEEQLVIAGFEIRCQIIWAKDHFAWGHGRYKFSHEPVFYGHVRGQSDEWFGDKTQQTLWRERKPPANRVHPTMKPVELIERAIQNSTRRGDLVIDFFGGSGSTMIGAQRLRRRCFMTELDPVYADVILRRWMRFTREAAVLDGKKFIDVERFRLAGIKKAAEKIPAAC